MKRPAHDDGAPTGAELGRHVLNVARGGALADHQRRRDFTA
jgi:hypothetical protein